MGNPASFTAAALAPGVAMGGHDDIAPAQVSSKAVDPVCGMVVDPDDDPPQQEFEGHPYYFCSDTCKQEFLNNPDQYRNKLAS